MRVKSVSARLLAAGFAAGLLLARFTAADPVADFYEGKRVRLVISSGAGGGYDAYGRSLARHMSRHLPGNPTIVPQNMPGAGGVKATTFLFNAAPRDGSTIGGVNRGVPMEPLFGNDRARYAPTAFNWLGSLNSEVSVCVSWGTTPVKTIQDAMRLELIVGASGANDTESFPAVLNNIIGTRFKVISGYPSGTALNLAMERREVDGRCGWSWTSARSQRGAWFESKTVNALVQVSLTKHPDLPDVPLVTEFARNQGDRDILELVLARLAMGRPYLIPPGVPAARVAALRKAFDATTRDPAFIADIARQKLELTPMNGTDLQALVAKLYRSPPELVARVKEAYVYTGPMARVEVELATHEGPVTGIRKSGRQITIDVGGEAVTAKVSGSRTTVTIDGKADKRGNVEVGMACSFTYPGDGEEAKRVDCTR